MKIKFLIYSCAFCILSLIPKNSLSQTYLIDSIKIDSATLVNTKAILNKLSTDLFEKNHFTDEGSILPYRLLKPKYYDPSKKYPLIITFHNSTRIGNDNEKQLEPLARIWLRDSIYNQCNCFILVPQFNTRSSLYSSGENGIVHSRPSKDVASILLLIDKIQHRYAIHKKKVFLIGYSMGASTAQNLMALAPQKFAALISIAGTPDFSNLKGLKHKKILIIHGEQDFENPYLGSKVLVEKLKGNKKLTFLNFPYLNHDNIMIPLLLNDKLSNWLFQ